MKPALRDQHVMQSKIVDARAEEAGERISGRFHDRLAFHVERSVQQDGNARNRIKLLEQSIKPFVLVWSNGLHASSTVNVDDRGDFASPLRPNALDEQHERGFFIPFEDFVCSFRENDRRERPEGLPVLHPLVQFVFHFGRPRIRQDAAITEGARPKFRTALEPSKYMALGQQFCRIPAYILAVPVYRLQPN